MPHKPRVKSTELKNLELLQKRISLTSKVKQYYFKLAKGYECDYYYQADKLFKKPQLEIINPLHQLSRTESLLKQLLLHLGFNPKISAFVAFINPSFTLYEAPLQMPFIFPTQINYLKSL